MSTLLFVLAAISLLDSTSLLPVCILPLSAILSGRQPLLGAASFMSGIFFVYAGSGLFLLVGFHSVFDVLGPSIFIASILDLYARCQVGSAPH